MVDALRSAWRVVRPRGFIVEPRPAATYQPRLLIRRGRERIEPGRIVRDTDLDIVAAQQAVRAVIREGLFEVIHRSRVPYRIRYRHPDELDAMVDSALNTNWQLPAASRRRLRREFRDGDVIEVSRVESLTILRKLGTR